MSVCLLKKDKASMREITPNHILSEEDIMPQTCTPKQLIVEQKTENSVKANEQLVETNIVEEESEDVFDILGLFILTLILGAFVLNIDGAIQFLYDIAKCLLYYFNM